MVAQHLQSSKPTHQHVESGGVLNVVNRVMKLTQGKLINSPIGMIGGTWSIYN